MRGTHPPATEPGPPPSTPLALCGSPRPPLTAHAPELSPPPLVLPPLGPIQVENRNRGLARLHFARSGPPPRTLGSPIAAATVELGSSSRFPPYSYRPPIAPLFPMLASQKRAPHLLRHSSVPKRARSAVLRPRRRSLPYPSRPTELRATCAPSWSAKSAVVSSP
jgi:hypothetical protein